MAARSVSEDDLSRLRDILDITRAGHAAPPAEAMFEVMRLMRGLVGCDYIQFHEQDSIDLTMPHLQPLMTAAYGQGSRAGSRPVPSLLTVRQREILCLVRLGMPNKRIGRLLGISEGTVRKHLENAFERLGVQSRTAAVAIAFGDQAATG